MTFDKQTIIGVVLACGAIGLVVWLTLDSWEIAASTAIANEGAVTVQESVLLDDPDMCEDHTGRCVSRP